MLEIPGVHAHHIDTGYREKSLREDKRDIHADWSAVLARQVRENSRLLFSLSYRILRDRDAAEDACQKALLAAWVSRAEIADPDRIKGWLATAVINESLAVLRRQKVERKVLRIIAAEEIGAGNTKLSGVDDSILLALADLRDEERGVVTLRVMHGLAGREVALLLGVSDGQVSKLLHRGMEQLRTTLADWKERSR